MSTTIHNALTRLANSVQALNRATREENNAAVQAVANPTPNNVRNVNQAARNAQNVRNVAMRAANNTVAVATNRVNGAVRNANRATANAVRAPTPNNVRNANRANANLNRTANQAAGAVQAANSVANAIN